MWRHEFQDGQLASPALLMVGSAVLALLGSLWVERYGGNVLHTGSPVSGTLNLEP